MFEYLPFFSLDNQEFHVIAIEKQMIETDNNKNFTLFMHYSIIFGSEKLDTNI